MDIQLVSFNRSNFLTKLWQSHQFRVIGTPQNIYRGSCYLREGRAISLDTSFDLVTFYTNMGIRY